MLTVSSVLKCQFHTKITSVLIVFTGFRFPRRGLPVVGKWCGWSAYKMQSTLRGDWGLGGVGLLDDLG